MKIRVPVQVRAGVKTVTIFYKMKWISTNERLPENYQLVLIYEPSDRVHLHKGVPSRYHAAQFVIVEDPIPGNFKRYRWLGDGRCSWNGQDVTFWAEIESAPGGSSTFAAI